MAVALALRDRGADLVLDLRRDLVEAVLVPGVGRDVLEDLVLGLAFEMGLATWDQYVASELLHVRPSPPLR
jgi:hypothetical protein